MLGYMFMGRLMITSAARAVSSNSSPSKVEKEEEELLVSCFIFGKCCENILFLKPKRRMKNFGKGIKTNLFGSAQVVW
jgi:hypothetical protein